MCLPLSKCITSKKTHTRDRPTRCFFWFCTVLAGSGELVAAISDLFRHISRLSAAPPSTAADQASSAPAHDTTPAMAQLFERVLMPRARLFYAVQQRRTQQAFGSLELISLCLNAFLLNVNPGFDCNNTLTLIRLTWFLISRRCSHDRVTGRSVR